MQRYVSLLFIWLTFSCAVSADTLKLVTTEWESFTNQGAHSERLNEIVKTALQRAGHTVRITTERPAFAGSGLNSGRYDGRIDFIDLNEQRVNFIYSAPYLPLYLHLVSKTADVETVRSFAQVRNSRVAIENRYAATPPLRLVRDIKWSRNPNTFESINNLADERSNYLLTDLLFFNEFNRLLQSENEELLHRSQQAIFQTALHLSLSQTVPNAQQIINDFNQQIQQMLLDGSMNKLLGVAWIVASNGSDSEAELISSLEVQHRADMLADNGELALYHAYPWGNADNAIASYRIDGKVFPSWTAATDYIRTNSRTVLQQERDSFLDPAAYQGILRTW
ncbi:hypothetical protein [Alteromonas flava]|uniref:hypothetical protein n=1 Tax=Alteromonas flava TaxID=2048003 RepID=UPI000C28C79B|nr:hypothetical protein [Alteromonas flava]